MVLYKNILFTVGLILVSVELLMGQTIPYKLYTPQDGLAQSQVLNIFQDSRGYMWIGTRDGFSSFNGASFNSFNANSGLPFSYIYQIGEDRDGNIRFFTGKWWCKYDGKKITSDSAMVRPFNGSFCIDRAKTIWVINVLDQELYYSKDWKKWTNAASKIKSLKNRKWVGLRFDEHFNRLILHDLNSRHTYSLRLGQLKKIFHGQVDIASERPNTRNKLHGFSNDSLFLVEQDTIRLIKKGFNFQIRNCIIKADGSLFFLAKGRNTFYTINKIGTIDSLPLKEFTNSLFLDNDDNIWIGTEQGLIRPFIKGIQNFDQNKLHSIWSMVEDNSKQMYFGSFFKHEIVRYHGQKFETLQINPIKNNRIKPESGSFYFGGSKDRNGNLYFSMPWGIMRYNGVKFSYFGKTTDDKSISVYNFFDSEKNVLLSGTNGGVNIFDSKTESVKYYGISKGLHPAGFVLGMTKDKKGNYWLATGVGFGRLNVGKDTIDKNFSRNLKNLPYYGTVSIYCDFKGTIWAGSTRGLLRFDEKRDSFVLVAPHIFRTSTSSIIGYRNKYLVVGALDGVYFLDLQEFYQKRGRLIIRCFNQHNGYLGIEPNQNCIYVDSKDNVWVAASDLVTKFTPSELDMSPKPLNPYITTINNEKIAFSQYGQVIRLPYGTNTAKIFFEAVGFERPLNAQFSYKLNNDKWSEWLAEDFAVLDHLASGTHTFSVRTRPSGTVNEQDIKETAIRFTISIPFYKEAYFPVVALLAVLFFLEFIRRQWRRGKETKKQHQAFILKQIELDRERNRQMKYLQIQTLQAQLNPHFIFNVLQAIQTRILLGSREVASRLIVDLGNLIRRFLDSSVNMDLSKMRNSEITLKEEINLLKSYIEFEQLQYNNSFDYEIHVGDEIEIVNVQVPPMLIQPYVENAIKHGILYEKDKHCCLKVNFRKTSDNVLVCSIIDNGVGRRRAREIQESFIRMYKSRGTQILDERIRIMQELEYGISVETFDNPEGGTIVELRIDAK
jgi:ligand-binding sensor domain-containing protein/two-component sensor histidine kinase